MQERGSTMAGKSGKRSFYTLHWAAATRDAPGLPCIKRQPSLRLGSGAVDREPEIVSLRQLAPLATTRAMASDNCTIRPGCFHASNGDPRNDSCLRLGLKTTDLELGGIRRCQRAPLAVTSHHATRSVVGCSTAFPRTYRACQQCMKVWGRYLRVMIGSVLEQDETIRARSC